MPPNSERGSVDDAFEKIEATLVSIRAQASGSWLKRILHPAGAASGQRDFNHAVASALRETVVVLRETVASQDVRLERLAREVTELRSLVSERSAELSHEVRERIQHLLDEQRVSLRQISLQASEEAVLADRARRALETRMDELARRLPERPA